MRKNRKNRSKYHEPYSLSNTLSQYQLNDEQVQGLKLIRNNKITVFTGAAGTAKTFTAVFAALQLFEQGEIDSIAVTRPQVSTEEMGFLPGSALEKISPYLAPVENFFDKFGGLRTFENMVKDNEIRIAPIAFMRGWTIERELLIIDESQNLTPQQLLLALTRIGEGGRIVITGDAQQSDIRGDSGLLKAAKLAERVDSIASMEFTINMRDPIVQEIIEAWEEQKGA